MESIELKGERAGLDKMKSPILQAWERTCTKKTPENPEQCVKKAKQKQVEILRKFGGKKKMNSGLNLKILMPAYVDIC